MYPQELELQTVIVTTTQALGTNPGSSQSTPGALNQLTISLAPTLIFFVHLFCFGFETGSHSYVAQADRPRLREWAYATTLSLSFL